MIHFILYVIIISIVGFFTFGCDSSDTRSLLRNIYFNHSQISCPPERPALEDRVNPAKCLSEHKPIITAHPYFPERSSFKLSPQNKYKVTINSIQNYQGESFLKIHSTGIIIKADDVGPLSYNNPWFRFIEDYQAMGIKISVGLIAQPLLQNSEMIQFLSTMNHDLVEIWLHGFDHKCPEFKGHDFTYQMEHILEGLYIIYKKLEIVPRTFGAPCNATDKTTIEVLSQFHGIRVWFLDDPDFRQKPQSINILRRTFECESKVGKVSARLFEDLQNSSIPLIVCQIHPASYDTSEREYFNKTISTLYRSGKRKFFLPYEFFKWNYDKVFENMTRINDHEYIIDLSKAKYEHVFDLPLYISEDNITIKKI